MRTMLWALIACGGDDGTGAACEEADDCFDGVEIEGEAVCLTDIPGGYCTHTCTDDASCCAAEGECEEGFSYFCEELESNPDRYCFVSCEDADGGADVCAELGDGWTCRSTGGGDPRKFCSPTE